MELSENKRIAKNTLYLYFRMILVMAVSLFTSRVILNALGVDDYGVYNVVGGVVSLFSIISSSLSTAVSRFMTFELGTGNRDRLKRVFATSLGIQLGLAFVVVILCGTVGFWFLNHRLNIAPSRISAANWVLLFSLLTFSVNLVSVPYNAAIVAHERMIAFAYVSILEVALKLGVAYMILITPFDRLILYSILILCVSLVIRLIYGIYCNRYFEESHTRPSYDSEIFREMSSFAGWNFIGSASSIIRDQGNNVILNIFFGTAVNAAYSLGMQVSNAVYAFSQNFMTALKPQITKSYAQGNTEYLMSLILRGSRYSFYLLWMMACIFLLNTQYVLELWLKDVPEYTVSFVRLFLLFVVSESVSQPLITAQLATGNIRNYQICVGGLKLLNLPLSYFFLRIGFSPYITLIVSISISIGMLLLRLYFLQGMIGLSPRTFVKKVVIKVLLVGTLSFVLSHMLTKGIPDSFFLFIIKSFLTLLVSASCIFYLGCTRDEQRFVVDKLKAVWNRIKK